MKSVDNNINKSLGNSDVMINFFKDAIENKKKIIVDGNEFEVLEHDVLFNLNGGSRCMMKINGKKVICFIRQNDDFGGIKIFIEDFLTNEQEENNNKKEKFELDKDKVDEEKVIKLKINNKIVKIHSSFLINSDFSVVSLPRLQNANYTNNDSLYLPLNCIQTIQNMNFYNFDKKRNRITGKNNSICTYVKCNDINLNRETNDNKKQLITDLFAQIKKEIKNENEGFYITFSADPDKSKEQMQNKNKNKINDCNKEKKDKKIENQTEDDMDIVCCSTEEKMIFFKKDQDANKYVKIKVLQKDREPDPLVKDRVFINKDLVYNINIKNGILEIYSLKYMEKISEIKLSTNLLTDNYFISRLDPKELTFMDKKTFEEQLKAYIIENGIFNNINNINNNSTNSLNATVKDKNTINGNSI